MLFKRLLPALLLVCTAALADELPIVIHGVGRSMEDNIRHHIGTISDKERAQPRLLRQKLKGSIQEATQALGHYESRFDYRLEDDELVIDIDPGPAVTWAEPDIQIDGTATEVEPIRKLVQEPPFKVGDPINHQLYETYKRQLLDLCQEYGYLDTRFEQTVLRVDLEQHRATPIVQLSSGERYRIELVEFSGSELDRELLERLSPLEVGDYYRKSDITQLHRNLQSSGYFREIDVQSNRIDDRRLLVATQLADAPSHQFSVGAGFGTDTGPRGKLRWERPHVTRHGHRLTSELSISKPQQDWSLQYRIPLQKPLDQSLNLTTSWQRKENEDTSSTVGSVGFFFSDRYDTTWVANYGVNYDDESYRQGSEPRKRVRYAIPAINFTEVVLPSGIDPTEGHKTWIAFTASAPVLGADTAFFRANAGYKRLFDLGRKQVLIARAEAGAIATDNIEEIVASQRFFTGGDQTVRGYDFESLAPRDDAGELIGGRYLNVASLEYSAKVLEQWRVALFTDTGRAFSSLDEPWSSSAGFGVRWLSPVGQIRVDIAFPLNKDENSSSWQLHIFMGPPL